MSFPSDYPHDRPSDAPLAMDLSGGGAAPPTAIENLAAKLGVPPSWLGMGGYLAAGISLGLVLILAMSIGRNGDGASSATSGSDTSPITDAIVRLHAREIGSSCWQGVEKNGPARLTVALEVGVDGKIRYAAASGETQAMRGCVEAHVRSWEFLPQLQAQTMALPFEIDRR